MIKIRTKKLSEKTSGFCDIIDITAKLRGHLEEEKIDRGQVTLFVPGSTAALTTIEYEPGLVQDLKEFVEKLIPSNKRHHHDDRWATTTAFLTCVQRFSAHRWLFRLRMAGWRSVLGSKSFWWTSITARAPAKSLFSS